MEGTPATGMGPRRAEDIVGRRLTFTGSQRREAGLGTRGCRASHGAESIGRRCRVRRRQPLAAGTKAARGCRTRILSPGPSEEPRGDERWRRTWPSAAGPGSRASKIETAEMGSPPRAAAPASGGRRGQLLLLLQALVSSRYGTTGSPEGRRPRRGLPRETFPYW